MAVSPQSPIKRLLHELPRGTPIDMDELAKRGADAKLASFYARSGWLVRLGHGVYALPGDETRTPSSTPGGVEMVERVSAASSFSKSGAKTARDG